MESAERITVMADVIRLALTPVFLITGVASLLGVLSNRLGRIIDRARTLERSLRDAKAAEISRLHDELKILSRRANLVYMAISLGVVCALLVCIVIATVFASLLLHINITTVVAVLFIAAMLVLIGALITFLREVFLATASLRIGPV